MNLNTNVVLYGRLRTLRRTFGKRGTNSRICPLIIQTKKNRIVTSIKLDIIQSDWSIFQDTMTDFVHCKLFLLYYHNLYKSGEKYIHIRKFVVADFDPGKTGKNICRRNTRGSSPGVWDKSKLLFHEMDRIKYYYQEE